MWEFVVQITNWYNLPFTVIAVLLLLYQILHIAFGVDSFGDLAQMLADRIAPKSRSTPLITIWEFVNFGGVPPLISVISFATFWAISGLAINFSLIKIIPIAFALPSAIAFALAISLICSHLVARLTSLIFPISARTPIDSTTFIGQTGRITSQKADENFGTVRVDGKQIGFTLYCRTDSSEPILSFGDQVLIWDYDPKTKFYKVEKINNEA